MDMWSLGVEGATWVNQAKQNHKENDEMKDKICLHLYFMHLPVVKD